MCKTRALCRQILFARAEALHAHGHVKEACQLTRHLAEEMLNNPPDLTIDAQPSAAVGGSGGAKSNTNACHFCQHRYTDLCDLI